ncbi:glycosyltransferase [Geovibrio thiophilus]|uniref:Glycosyltransferase n=1 Tax=Geovibrio thiophilus TaxID=139438 RepID=A0A3R5UTJ3_9BACT|nr:glycosyltransferase [Geovibrio thiophilus]QAR32105.1 glycosyltransferase [Geovibrio thiophilus]
MSGRPFISVILNNYNYGRYLEDAVRSVLSQSFSDFELIIVDDGSADDSRIIAEKLAAEDSRISPVFKANGGQASAFNAGVKASSGEVLCFLDSDDMYAPTKLEETAKAHMEGAEYIYTDHQAVDGNGRECGDGLKRYPYCGWNIFPVYYLSKYPGNVTSTLSVSRKLAEKIFPVNEEDWRIQADDTIVFQAAFLAKSLYIDKKLTLYRLHGGNGYYGKEHSEDFKYTLLRRRNSLKDEALKKAGISGTFLKNGWNLSSEFRTREYMDKELLKLYRRILWYCMDMPLLGKIKTDRELKRIFRERKID